MMLFLIGMAVGVGLPALAIGVALWVIAYEPEESGAPERHPLNTLHEKHGYERWGA